MTRAAAPAAKPARAAAAGAVRPRASAPPTPAPAAASAPATPAALGYRMPAEWERHAATWLAWPHQPRDWPGKLAMIPWVYGEVVRQLVPGERVRILVQDAAAEKRARAVLDGVGVDGARVDFFRIPTDRSWTRDTCPLFVRRDARGRGDADADADADGDVALTDWKFNGWAKYPNHRLDDALPARIAARQQRTRFVATAAPTAGDGARGGKPRQLVLEGGSIDVDGAGTLLSTEECLLSPVQARNPGLSRQTLEQAFADYLGVSKVLWLGQGIAGDDTHGHVDDLARFVGPRTIVLAEESDRQDVNYAPLAENRERLTGATNAAGERIEVVSLPMPAPLTFDGVRLPASYANFYISNAAVLVPTFNDPKDRRALGILAELFPDRRVVGIHAVDLVWGLGTLHCMTQQEPAAGA